MLCNRMQLGTFIVSLVLCLAIAVPVIQATEDETDVTLEVEPESPEMIIIDHDEYIDHDGTQSVDFEIHTQSEDDAVEEVHIYLDYIGGLSAGDAEDSYASGDIYDDTVWDEGVYDDTEVFDDDIDFARYGDWEVTAEVIPAEGFDDDEAVDEEPFDVAEHMSIERAEDGEASGIPGDDLVGDDFNVPGEERTPEIEITSNANWDLVFEDGLLVGDGDDIPVEGGYNLPGTLNPSLEESFEIHYEVSIPIGQESGTYTTSDTGGESVTHDLLMDE